MSSTSHGAAMLAAALGSSTSTPQSSAPLAARRSSSNSSGLRSTSSWHGDHMVMGATSAERSVHTGPAVAAAAARRRRQPQRTTSLLHIRANHHHHYQQRPPKVPRQQLLQQQRQRVHIHAATRPAAAPQPVTANATTATNVTKAALASRTRRRSRASPKPAPPPLSQLLGVPIAAAQHPRHKPVPPKSPAAPPTPPPPLPPPAPLDTAPLPPHDAFSAKGWRRGTPQASRLATIVEHWQRVSQKQRGATTAPPPGSTTTSKPRARWQHAIQQVRGLVRHHSHDNVLTGQTVDEVAKATPRAAARIKAAAVVRRAAKRAVNPWRHMAIETEATERGIQHEYDAATGTWHKKRVLVKLQRTSFAHGAQRQCFRMMCRTYQEGNFYALMRKPLQSVVRGWGRKTARRVVAKLRIPNRTGDLVQLLLPRSSTADHVRAVVDEFAYTEAQRQQVWRKLDGLVASWLKDEKRWRRARNMVAKSYIEEDVGAEARAGYWEDAKLQMVAKMWAEEFNKQQPPKKIDIIRVSVVELIDRPRRPLMAAEALITGTYRKYNNNTGHLVHSLHRETPQAFSHFTFERSKQKLMVVDIQGVGDIYTDPQIHTANGAGFGQGNLGIRGMALFFSTHTCNRLCKWLRLRPFRRHPVEDRIVHQAIAARRRAEEEAITPHVAGGAGGGAGAGAGAGAEVGASDNSGAPSRPAKRQPTQQPPFPPRPQAVSAARSRSGGSATSDASRVSTGSRRFKSWMRRATVLRCVAPFGGKDLLPGGASPQVLASTAAHRRPSVDVSVALKEHLRHRSRSASSASSASSSDLPTGDGTASTTASEERPRPDKSATGLAKAAGAAAAAASAATDWSATGVRTGMQRLATGKRRADAKSRAHASTDPSQWRPDSSDEEEDDGVTTGSHGTSAAAVATGSEACTAADIIRSTVHYDLAVCHAIGRLELMEKPTREAMLFHLQRACESCLAAQLAMAALHSGAAYGAFQAGLVAEDIEKAFNYTRMAALQHDHRESLVAVARAHAAGEHGLNKSWGNAVDLLEQAAQAKVDDEDAAFAQPAHVLLAEAAAMVATGGPELEQDTEQAAELFEQAAEAAMKDRDSNSAGSYLIRVEEFRAA